jgi:hypothetical protein
MSLYDHVLGTEMHVTGISGVYFENKAKSTEFYYKYIYTLMYWLYEWKYRYMHSDSWSFRKFLFHNFITKHG